MTDALTDEFKQAMRRLASTVAIVTAEHEGEWYGMTATAVTSASADPPALAVGVNRTASIHLPITASGRMCVNLLRTRHDVLVAPFSGGTSRAERFDHGDWLNDDGIPYLADAQVSFFCRVEAELAYGSHTLFVGRIERLVVDPSVEPLIWQDGRMAMTAALPEPPPAEGPED